MTPNPPGTKASRLFAELSISQAVWDEHLPQFASRLLSPLAWRALPVWQEHDVVRAFAHGYEKRPEVLDSWSGNTFKDFIFHVMQNYGVPVFSHIFGLDPEVEAKVLLNKPEHIAGAARLAVLGAVPEDIPACFEGHGASAKYMTENAPQLDMNQDIRRLMMFTRHQHYMGYIDFFGLEDEVVLRALDKLEKPGSQNQTLARMGPLMLKAQQEGLDLGQCLIMWSETLASPERVLEFVRDGMPLDYALMLTEPLSGR